jgi:hypothetical protein
LEKKVLNSFTFEIYFFANSLMKSCGKLESNMTYATSGTGTAYPSRAPEFTPVFFYVVCVAQFLFFSVVFCGSLFVLLSKII